MQGLSVRWLRIEELAKTGHSALLSDVPGPLSGAPAPLSDAYYTVLYCTILLRYTLVNSFNATTLVS